MFLTLLDVGGVRTVSADQLLGELIALVETLGSNFNAVLEVVEFVLEYLEPEMSLKLAQSH